MNAAFALLFIFAAQAFPDVQRVTEYDYDTAGNIVGIRTVQNVGPPQVNSLQPAYIHINSRVTVTATGINLNLAEVTTADSGLTISNVSATEYQVVFSIQADESAVVGPATLNFTTRLGTDPELFTVAEKTPVISTDPNPIVLKPDNQLVEVSLLFESSFETDQVYDIATTNPSIASVVEESITLLAGEREASVHLKGLALGSTALEINQLANNLALGIPVIVTEDRLPAGVYAFYSTPVGVTVTVAQESNSSAWFLSRPVGVVSFTGQYAISDAWFLTRSVGVVSFTGQYPISDGPFLSRLTGVTAFLDEGEVADGLYIAHPAGVLLGIVADQVTPSSVPRGSSLTLILSGNELHSVTAASFIPADGITITGGLSFSPDGGQLDIPVSIGSSAPTGPRAISLTTPQGEVLASQPLIIE